MLTKDKMRKVFWGGGKVLVLVNYSDGTPFCAI